MCANTPVCTGAYYTPSTVKYPQQATDYAATALAGMEGGKDTHLFVLRGVGLEGRLKVVLYQGHLRPLRWRGAEHLVDRPQALLRIRNAVLQ